MLQVVNLHPSCGLDNEPEWVIFNEFVLTTRPYIRTVTTVQPEWYAYHTAPRRNCNSNPSRITCRLLELAPAYYDLREWKDSEYTKALKKVQEKRASKRVSKQGTPVDDTRKSKKFKSS